MAKTKRKKKSSHNIIHVTIKNRRMASSLSKNSSYSKSVDRQKESKSSINSSAQVIEDRSIDDKDITINYHRGMKKKNKKTWKQRCIILSMIIILFVILILAIILPLLYIKTSSTSMRTTPVLRWNTTGITIAGVLNKPGSTNNQLYLPFDIALDYMNNLYVADRLNNRTQKFSFGNLTGRTIAGNLTANAAPTQLFFPSGVTVDSNQNLYIADTFNNRAVYWPPGATSGIRIGGSIPNPSNTFASTYGISLDATSNTLYVVDRANHRIMSFKSIWSNGTLVLGGTNATGPNKTELSLPIGLHFDYVSNSLIVSNTNTNNIIRYVISANSYTYVAGNINGSAGATSTSFNNPTGVTMDPMGHIYVADVDNNRIQFFYHDGSNGTTIAGFSGLGNDNATILNGPRAVRLDSQLNLYVADCNHHRIQQFLRY